MTSKLSASAPSSLLLLLLLLLLAPPARAQQVSPPAEPVVEDPGVIKIDTNLIQIRADVRDEQGVPVGKDRIRASCRLTEDGVAQAIDAIEVQPRSRPLVMAATVDLGGGMRKRIPMLKSAMLTLLGQLRAGDAWVLAASHPDSHTSFRSSSYRDLPEPYEIRRSEAVLPADDQRSLSSLFMSDDPSPGSGSLASAIFSTSDQIKEFPQGSRKALVVFSDGGGQWPRQALDEVKALGVEVLEIQFASATGAGAPLAQTVQSQRVDYPDFESLRGSLRDFVRGRDEEYVLRYYPLKDLAGVKKLRLSLDCDEGIGGRILGAATSGQPGGGK